MLVAIAPETMQIEQREGFKLALPKFLWKVLEARAKEFHNGDLQECVAALAAKEFIDWFVAASKKVLQAPAPSLN